MPAEFCLDGKRRKAPDPPIVSSSRGESVTADRGDEPLHHLVRGIESADQQRREFLIAPGSELVHRHTFDADLLEGEQSIGHPTRLTGETFK